MVPRPQFLQSLQPQPKGRLLHPLRLLPKEQWPPSLSVEVIGAEEVPTEETEVTPLIAVPDEADKIIVEAQTQTQTLTPPTKAKVVRNLIKKGQEHLQMSQIQPVLSIGRRDETRLIVLIPLIVTGLESSNQDLHPPLPEQLASSEFKK